MMTRRIKYLLVAMSAPLFPLCLQAQEAQEDNTFGGCSYDFSKAVQLEAYYIYYTFNNRPAQHVLGIGLNFTI